MVIGPTPPGTGLVDCELLTAADGQSTRNGSESRCRLYYLYHLLLLNKGNTQMVFDDLECLGIHQTVHIAMVDRQYEILESLVGFY